MCCSPQQVTKFKGDCPDSEGWIFNCSDCKQADIFIHMLKHILEHVGAEHKFGGDVHSSIINEENVTVSLPGTPTCSAGHPGDPMQEDWIKDMILKGEIDRCIKRKSTLR